MRTVDTEQSLDGGRDRIDFCTIVANNFLAHAAALSKSLSEHHSDFRFHVCIADLPHPGIDYAAFPGEVVFAHELGVPAFESLAFRSSTLELCTAVKPFLLRHLRDRLGARRAIYLDPDVLVLDSLDDLIARLKDSSLVLIPHITMPADNERDPAERRIRLSGVYNLGFLGIQLDDSTATFLAWWGERLRSFCFADPLNGLFVDQSWVDFAPCFCDRVAIERDPRYDIAYWNLDQRPVRRSQGRWTCEAGPVRFFHFSGFDAGRPEQLSRFDNRVGREQQERISGLLAEYRDRLEAEGWEEFRSIPYGYERFLPEGSRIPSVARRLLARVDPHGVRWPDPFRSDVEDSFFGWLTKPIELGLGTLNRLALGVWESSPTIVEQFANPCLEGLPAFVAWMRSQAATGEIDAPLLESVRVRDRFLASTETYLQLPHRPLSGLLRPRPRDRYARLGIDLADPGAVEWLNDLVYEDPKGPPLSRLALLVHGSDERIARAFPEARGSEREAFAVWFCREGALELGLDSEFVRPVFDSLPERARARMAEEPWRARLLVDATALGSSAPAPDVAPNPEPIPRSSGTRPSGAPGATGGITLLGGFRGSGVDALLVRSSERLLAATGLSCARVDLDLDPWGRVLDGRWLLPEGSPHEILLAHVPADRAPWLLGWMAGAATMGIHRIGYLAWREESWPPQYSDRFGHFHEIWAPSESVARTLARATALPLEVHTPFLDLPELPTRGEEGLRFPNVEHRVFLAIESTEPPEVARSIACLQAVADASAELGRRIGVYIAPCLAGEWCVGEVELERCLALLAEAAPSILPLRILRASQVDGALAETRSGGLVLVPRRRGVLSTIAARAMARGLPVSGDSEGVLSGLLDEATGYPLELAGADLGSASSRPVPSGEEIRLAVRRALARALADPDGAKRRAAAADRVERLHGLVACRARLVDALERITTRSVARQRST